MSAKKTTTVKAHAKSNFRKGDKVVIISGADKGKTGNVIEVIRDKQRLVVEDIKMVKKHRKPTQNTPGGIIEMPASIHVSNVMLMDPKSGEPTRVGRREEDGKTVRYAKKSGEIIKG